MKSDLFYALVAQLNRHTYAYGTRIFCECGWQSKSRFDLGAETNEWAYHAAEHLERSLGAGAALPPRSTESP